MLQNYECVFIAWHNLSKTVIGNSTNIFCPSGVALTRVVVNMIFISSKRRRIGSRDGYLSFR